MVQHEPMPDEAPPQEPLAGGYVSAVVRIADTVRRGPGPNTEFVRRLLGFFEQVGCHNDLSPRNTVYRGHGNGLPTG